MTAAPEKVRYGIPTDVAELFGQLPDPKVRAKLAERYDYLVVRLAKTVAYARGYQQDDLEQSGRIGLLQAIDSFKLEHGCDFPQFGRPRILGQMIDDIREEQWQPRTVGRRSSKLRETRDYILITENRRNIDEEDVLLVQNMMHPTRPIDRVEASRIVRDGDMPVMMQLHAARKANSGNRSGSGENEDLECTLAHFAICPRTQEPSFNLEMTEQVDYLLQRLPEKTRVILTSFHLRGMYMKDIGHLDNVDLSESRVCQINKVALGQLRESLQADAMGDFRHREVGEKIAC